MKEQLYEKVVTYENFDYQNGKTDLSHLFIFLIGFFVGFLAAKGGRKKDGKKEEHVLPPASHQPPAKPQP